MDAATVAPVAGPNGKEAGLALVLPGLLLALSVLCAAWLDLAPRPDRPVLAVFPPWWSRAGTLDAVLVADGDLVGLGRWPDMVVAASSRAGLGQRLRRRGAWLLLDPRGLAGCLAASGAGAR